MDKIEMLTSPTIHAAAFAADEIEAKRLCEETQKLWDDGQSFNPEAGAYQWFGLDPRQSDNQEEFDAAVSYLETKLAALAIRKTIGQMDREECTGLVRALDHLDLGARVQVFGEELSSGEIRVSWNEQHSDEAPIPPTPWLAPEI